jgi:hypothetical protein
MSRMRRIWIAAVLAGVVVSTASGRADAVPLTLMDLGSIGATGAFSSSLSGLSLAQATTLVVEHNLAGRRAQLVKPLKQSTPVLPVPVDATGAAAQEPLVLILLGTGLIGVARLRLWRRWGR